MWHKPQKSAETQSFSPLLSNLNQGNNDFVYVSALEKILNSPLEDSREAYAVFDKGTNVSGYFTTIGEKPYVEPKEAYVVVSSDSTTLTFYCDDQRSMRDGVEGWTHGIEEEKNGYPIWLNAEFNEFGHIQCIKPYETIIFNVSFKDVRPKSCRFWFEDCAKLTKIEGIEYLNTSEVTDMCSMFCNCSNLTTLDVSNFNTENVTTMWHMFAYCRKITELNVSHFNTNNVEDMGNMFRGCSCLTSLDVSKFNTENVSYIGYMFGECSSLTTLDVSNFNTENVTNMDNMFYDCTNLKTIFVGDNWETFSVTSSGYMFLGCPNLYGGKGSNPSTLGVTDATYARIDGGADAPGYFTRVGEQPWVPVSIDLTTLPNKTEYYINDDLNLEGGELTATFPDNTTKITSLSNAKVSGFDNTKIGEQTLTVEFMGKTTTFDVIVNEDTRKVVYLDANMHSIPKGEDISNYGFWVHYDNGDSDFKKFSDYGVTLSGLNVNIAGVQDVEISYHGYTWKGQFDIYKPIASFDFTNVKTELNLNTDEKLSGVVIVNNEDGSSYRIDINRMSAIVPNEYGDGYWHINSNETFDKTLGEHELRVYYCEKESTLKYTFYNGPMPYAVFDDKTGILTFYYDGNKPDGAYGMRTEYDDEWGIVKDQITKVVFNESFADYRPTSCAHWFECFWELTEIVDMEKYLNTEFVTDMSNMFFNTITRVVDLSNFDTKNVTNMTNMFNASFIETIYVGDKWSTESVTESDYIFSSCSELFGGKGTRCEESDIKYAHIDGGVDNPGYFTKKGETPKISIEFEKLPKTEYILAERINYFVSGL